MGIFTSTEGTAILVTQTGGISTEIFTDVTTENTLNRSLVNNIGTDTSENANDGNSVASGTLTRAYGQGTDELVNTLFIGKAEFDLVIDPNNIRVAGTPIVNEALLQADGATGPDGVAKVFYSAYHAVRSSVLATSVTVDTVDLTEGTNYTMEYDNTGAVGKGMVIKFLVPPQATATFDYTPETGGLDMHVGCRLTNVQVNPDGSSDDQVSGTFPYVSRDWIITIGPTNPNPAL